MAASTDRFCHALQGKKNPLLDWNNPRHLYTLDLTPSGFWPLVNLKSILKDKHFKALKNSEYCDSSAECFQHWQYCWTNVYQFEHASLKASVQKYFQWNLSMNLEDTPLMQHGMGPVHSSFGSKFRCKTIQTWILWPSLRINIQKEYCVITNFTVWGAYYKLFHHFVTEMSCVRHV
jgi:hypothetical protein